MSASAEHRRSFSEDGTLFAALQARAASAFSALDALSPPRAPWHSGVPGAAAGAAAHAGAGAFRTGAGGAGAAADDAPPPEALAALSPLTLRPSGPFDDRPASCKPKARARHTQRLDSYTHTFLHSA